MASEVMTEERLAWIAEWVAKVKPAEAYYGTMQRFMRELLEEVRRQRSEIARGNQEIEQLNAELTAERDENRELTAHVEDVEAELETLRAGLGEPADPDDRFQIGHTYRSENGYFEFYCERLIGDLAIGIETVLEEWHVYPGLRLRKWATIGPSVGYIDVTEEGSDDA